MKEPIEKAMKIGDFPNFFFNFSWDDICLIDSSSNPSVSWSVFSSACTCFDFFFFSFFDFEFFFFLDPQQYRLRTPCWPTIGGFARGLQFLLAGGRIISINQSWIMDYYISVVRSKCWRAVLGNQLVLICCLNFDAYIR